MNWPVSSLADSSLTRSSLADFSLAQTASSREGKVIGLTGFESELFVDACSRRKDAGPAKFARQNLWLQEGGR